MDNLQKTTINELTVDDILNLPDGQRAEMINGVWYDMASPSSFHQELVNTILYALTDHIRKNGEKCKVYPAPFAVFIKKDKTNYVEPDVSVICDKSKISDRGCEGAPDITVEIVSPSAECRDYLDKLMLYQASGVREYWIINPRTETTIVYYFSEENEDGEKGNVRQCLFSEEICSGVLEGFTLTLTDYLSESN